jgi:hypothetical protein
MNRSGVRLCANYSFARLGANALEHIRVARIRGQKWPQDGELTYRRFKSNKWLRKNFARCETDHDGQSPQEYANCK